MSILALIGLVMVCVGGMVIGMTLLVHAVGEALDEAERERR